MTRAELRAFGLQYGTLEAVKQNYRQLERAGFTAKQIARAIAKLHPKLFVNLRICADGTPEVIDKRLRWVRRLDWTDDGVRCGGCGSWKFKHQLVKRQCKYCRDYLAMQKWSRAQRRKVRRA